VGICDPVGIGELSIVSGSIQALENSG
jgi:hypothetical protein